MGSSFSINDLSSYRLSFDFSNRVWNIVLKWDWFAKKTIGTQLVRSTDSISANIAEGFGRRTKTDKIHFYRYSQSSLAESKDWFNKAIHRNLIPDEDIEYIEETLRKLPIELNQLIKFTNEKLKF